MSDVPGVEVPEIDIRETEQELVNKAQDAVSQCNWVVGECAAKWTTKYARGRTDADFATLVGLSPDQVYQRRRVWETFGDVYGNYAALKWSHFYVALNWDDAPECLQWAEENEATVAEMKAWRRAVRGEEVGEDPTHDEWAGPTGIAYVPDAPTAVRDPDSFREGGGRSGGEVRVAENGTEYAGTVTGFARESDAPTDDVPRRAGGDGGTATSDRPGVSTEQLLARMTSTLERMTKAMTPDVTEGYGRLPQKLRTRFEAAVEAFTAKAEELV